MRFFGQQLSLNYESFIDGNHQGKIQEHQKCKQIHGINIKKEKILPISVTIDMFSFFITQRL